MEIYIAFFAGSLSAVLLAVIYLADRWEPEPVELIQSSFLSGLMAQLVLILAVSFAGGNTSWSGPWILVTVVGIALYLPFQLNRQPELDERFDGIVYAVAFAGGATCAIHLYNLPGVVAASPFRAALGEGAEPDLRDLMILAGSGGFVGELGQGLVVISIAALIGAVIGTLQMAGASPTRTAAVCTLVALVAGGAEFLVGGMWVFRLMLVLAAVVVAFAIKRRSVFRDRPQPAESDVLVAGFKTVLMVLGAALLAMVLLQAVVEEPEPLSEVATVEQRSAVAP